jgi:hypothetical protein
MRGGWGDGSMAGARLGIGAAATWPRGLVGAIARGGYYTNAELEKTWMAARVPREAPLRLNTPWSCITLVWVSGRARLGTCVGSPQIILSV